MVCRLILKQCGFNKNKETDKRFITILEERKESFKGKVSNVLKATVARNDKFKVNNSCSFW